MKPDFPTDNPQHWHDEAAQQEALEALEAEDVQELKRIFREERGLSFHRLVAELIREKL